MDKAHLVNLIKQYQSKTSRKTLFSKKEIRVALLERFLASSDDDEVSFQDYLDYINKHHPQYKNLFSATYLKSRSPDALLFCVFQGLECELVDSKKENIRHSTVEKLERKEESPATPVIESKPPLWLPQEMPYGDVSLEWSRLFKSHPDTPQYALGATAFALLPNGNLLQGIFDHYNAVYELVLLGSAGERTVLFQHIGEAATPGLRDAAKRCGATALTVLPDGQILQGISNLALNEIAILNLETKARTILFSSFYPRPAWSHAIDARNGATALAVLQDGRVLQGISFRDLHEIAILNLQDRTRIILYSNRDLQIQSEDPQAYRCGATALAALPDGRILQGISTCDFFEMAILNLSDKTRTILNSSGNPPIQGPAMHRFGAKALAVFPNGEILQGFYYVRSDRNIIPELSWSKLRLVNGENILRALECHLIPAMVDIVGQFLYPVPTSYFVSQSKTASKRILFGISDPLVAPLICEYTRKSEESPMSEKERTCALMETIQEWIKIAKKKCVIYSAGAREDLAVANCFQAFIDYVSTELTFDGIVKLQHHRLEITDVLYNEIYELWKLLTTLYKIYSDLKNISLLNLSDRQEISFLQEMQNHVARCFIHMRSELELGDKENVRENITASLTSLYISINDYVNLIPKTSKDFLGKTIENPLYRKIMNICANNTHFKQKTLQPYTQTWPL